MQDIWSHDQKKNGLGHINPVHDYVMGSLALAVGGLGASRRELAVARSQASVRGTQGLGGWK